MIRKNRVKGQDPSWVKGQETVPEKNSSARMDELTVRKYSLPGPRGPDLDFKPSPVTVGQQNVAGVT